MGRIGAKPLTWLRNLPWRTAISQILWQRIPWCPASSMPGTTTSSQTPNRLATSATVFFPALGEISTLMEAPACLPQVSTLTKVQLGQQQEDVRGSGAPCDDLSYRKQSCLKSWSFWVKGWLGMPSITSFFPVFNSHFCAKHMYKLRLWQQQSPFWGGIWRSTLLSVGEYVGLSYVQQVEDAFEVWADGCGSVVVVSRDGRLGCTAEVNGNDGVILGEDGTDVWDVKIWFCDWISLC